MRGHDMRLNLRSLFAITSALLIASLIFACGQGLYAQGRGAQPAQENADSNRLVAGGGISVPGWTGQVDDNAAAAGQMVKDAKLVPDGKGMRVTTGPAITYWNPANKATGD